MLIFMPGFLHRAAQALMEAGLYAGISVLKMPDIGLALGVLRMTAALALYGLPARCSRWLLPTYIFSPSSASSVSSMLRFRQVGHSSARGGLALCIIILLNQ